MGVCVCSGKDAKMRFEKQYNGYMRVRRLGMYKRMEGGRVQTGVGCFQSKIIIFRCPSVYGSYRCICQLRYVHTRRVAFLLHRFLYIYYVCTCLHLRKKLLYEYNGEVLKNVLVCAALNPTWLNSYLQTQVCQRQCFLV